MISRVRSLGPLDGCACELGVMDSFLGLMEREALEILGVYQCLGLCDVTQVLQSSHMIGSVLCVLCAMLLFVLCYSSIPKRSKTRESTYEYLLCPMLLKGCEALKRLEMH